MWSISKDQSCGICFSHLAATAEIGVFSHDGVVSGAVECPVVYKRHFALTESAPSMTIRAVVERSSAAVARRQELWWCVPDERLNDPLIRELLMQFVCIPLGGIPSLIFSFLYVCCYFLVLFSVFFFTTPRPPFYQCVKIPRLNNYLKIPNSSCWQA